MNQAHILPEAYNFTSCISCRRSSFLEVKDTDTIGRPEKKTLEYGHVSHLGGPERSGSRLHLEDVQFWI